MSDNLFKEKFKEISEEIKKTLNWEIDYPCPNCGHKSREDAFKAIEITAGLSSWDCPYCIMEQKGMHEDADKDDVRNPNFRELVETFQLPFLDGYLQCLLLCQDRDIYLYFEDDESEPTKPLPAFWYDLSSAFVKIYTALEVYLSNQTRRQIQEKGIKEDVIKYIKPQVRDSFEMWEKLGIWNGLGERINEKELKELKRITGRFFSCQETRNKIVHDGYIVTREEFLEVFASVGRFIAGTQKYLDSHSGDIFSITKRRQDEM